MRRTPLVFRAIVPSVALLLLVPAATWGEPPAKKSGEAAKPASQNAQAPASSKEKTTVVTKETTMDGWEIDGPVFLRSADPEPPGEVVIKNIFAWEHFKKSEEGKPWEYVNKGEDRDEYEYEFELEWGVIENHELIFEVPFQVGDGQVDGNGDLTIGWHWRLVNEQDWMPAFALRNFVRIPTGIGSSGVDYELRGLFTKTLIPGSTRLHFNPFAKSVNGDNEEDAEDFQYGAAIGVDHRISDDLLFITDYIYSSGETEDANPSNHEAEFGLDWGFAENQKLCFKVLVGVDGDDDGPEYGADISYVISFGG